VWNAIATSDKVHAEISDLDAFHGSHHDFVMDINMLAFSKNA